MMRKLRSVYVLYSEFDILTKDENIGIFTTRKKALVAAKKYNDETGIGIQNLSIYRYTLDKIYG